MTCSTTWVNNNELRSFFLECCEPPTAGTSAEDFSGGADAGRMVWTQEVDVIKLLIYYPAIAERLFGYPLRTMEELRGECSALCQSAENNSGQPNPLHSVTPATLSIRFTHFPPVQVSPLPSLPPPQGMLVQVWGTVVRMSTKRVVPFLVHFMCRNCRHTVEYYTTPLDRSFIPKLCCESVACKKEPLTVVEQVWMDYSECRLQQRSRGSGKLPRSTLVTLDDELSVKCSVGQYVEVIGVLFKQWKHVFPSSIPSVEPVIWATNVMPMESYRGGGEVSSGEKLEASRSTSMIKTASGKRNYPFGPGSTPEHFFFFFKKRKLARTVALTRSIAPQLSGLFAPRLAMLLATVGGAPCHFFSTVPSSSGEKYSTSLRERSTGGSGGGGSPLRIRSTVHCLLVGDPSTGKSQLLRFASEIAPRSTCTTGMGSTSAGLTVAATKEGGEWVLEPGALVLSDGGSCIIDELRTVAVADRASLHEAMEQQTISVAKGGVVTKLSTNCAVIAACNPPSLRSGKGSLMTTVSVGVGGPLLSRFDLVFLLWDVPQKNIDEKIADHILWCSGGVPPNSAAVSTKLLPFEMVSSHSSPHTAPILSAEEISKYLCWVKRQYRHIEGPKLSDHAALLLGYYFDILRARGASPALDDCIPVTIRMLESLVRLTQAYAKLHLQTVCSIDDAAMGIFLMERSAHGLKCPLGINDENGSPLYSSSRSLDDIFLSDSNKDIGKQEEVLRSLIRVILEYSATHHPSQPLNSPELHWDFLSSSCSLSSQKDDQADENNERKHMEDENVDAGRNNILEERRKRIPAFLRYSEDSQLASFSTITLENSQQRSFLSSSNSTQIVDHLHNIISSPCESSSRTSTVTVW